MPTCAVPASRGRRKLLVTVILTLIASAIHFADNACHLDQYPGPRWLTRNVILAAWLVLLAIAIAAYRSGARWALVSYGTLGFAGLAHYAMPHAGGLPLRCAVTISAEAPTSTLLLLYVTARRPAA